MPQDDSTPRGDSRVVDRRSVLASFSLAGVLGSTGLVSATGGRDPGPKKDELIVGVSADVADVRGAVRSAVPGDADVVHANETIHYAVVSVPSSTPDRARERIVEAVSGLDHVEYVEPNVTVEAIGEPDDPYYDHQHAPQQVNCEDAWEVTTGDEDVVVAVVDQGIQYDHPTIDGTIDDRVGEDFVGRGGDPSPVSDEERHGTHVGGIAAGETDNGEGHAGISDCSLLSLRALDRHGSGALSDVADAIQWAADADADVINLSLGVGGDYATLANACEYAGDRGSLLVGAAGNQGAEDVLYPAAYDAVIGVSAVDANDAIASFSNRGPAIDLAAPGTRLVSAVPWDGYARMSGTSMAAPVVSGVAALTLSAYPDLSRAELREHLQETAVDVGLGSDAQGDGRVDAGAAVTTDPYPDDGEDDPNEGDDADGGDDGDDEETSQCGDERVTASADGWLFSDWWSESDRYSYPLRTANPCSATLTLDVPAGAEFHLYVTVDGRSPSRWDHDEAVAGTGGDESIALSLSDDEELGIQVHAASGSGKYELTIEERGR